MNNVTYISREIAQKKLVNESICDLCKQVYFRRDIRSKGNICGRPECQSAWFSRPKTVRRFVKDTVTGQRREVFKDVLTPREVELILENPEKGKIISRGPYNDVRKGD